MPVSTKLLKSANSLCTSKVWSSVVEVGGQVEIYVKICANA